MIELYRRVSPVKHDVRSHIRAGTRVHKYTRGHGKHKDVAPKVVQKSYIKSRLSSEPRFRIVVNTTKGSKTITLNSNDYKSAGERALLLSEGIPQSIKGTRVVNRV